VVTFTTGNHHNFDMHTDSFGTSISYDGVVHGGQWVILTPTTPALLGIGVMAAQRRR
jgi:hypothetical protein